MLWDNSINLPNTPLVNLNVVSPDTDIWRFVSSSHCIFAPGSIKQWKIHTISRETWSLSLADIKYIPPLFQKYIERVNECDDKWELFSDALILEFSVEDCWNDIDSLKNILKELLTTIASSDPTGHNCITDWNPNDKDWYFSYEQEEIFVFAFAPFYPSSHSRTTYGTNSIFVSIQADRWFAYHMKQVWWREEFNKIRMKIRNRFELLWHPYDNIEHSLGTYPPEYINIIKSPYQSYRNIKPLLPGDPIVKWWE